MVLGLMSCGIFIFFFFLSFLLFPIFIYSYKYSVLEFDSCNFFKYHSFFWHFLGYIYFFFFLSFSFCDASNANTHNGTPAHRMRNKKKNTCSLHFLKKKKNQRTNFFFHFFLFEKVYIKLSTSYQTKSHGLFSIFFFLSLSISLGRALSLSFSPSLAFVIKRCITYTFFLYFAPFLFFSFICQRVNNNYLNERLIFLSSRFTLFLTFIFFFPLRSSTMGDTYFFFFCLFFSIYVYITAPSWIHA